MTEEKLSQIEAAEAFLRARGFRHVRVRHLGSQARIEVEPNELSRFQDRALKHAVHAAFCQIGFSAVSVAPYRPGGADTTPVRELLLAR